MLKSEFNRIIRVIKDDLKMWTTEGICGKDYNADMNIIGSLHLFVDDKPMDLENAIALADRYGDSEAFCDVLDVIMGFEKGESYMRKPIALIVGGNILHKGLNANQNYSLVITNAHCQIPTKTIRTIIDEFLPSDKMLLITDDCNGDYIQSTLQNFKQDDNFLGEVLFNFRKTNDGKRLYTAKLTFNLLSKEKHDYAFRFDRFLEQNRLTF